MILCIDPGLRGCGVAVFNEAGILQRAAYVKNTVERGNGYEAYQAMGQAIRIWYTEKAPFEPKELLIEHPVVYPGMPQTDLNDLLSVVACGTAAACMFFTPSKSILPADWKGQVKKEVMTERIRSKLTASELVELEHCIKSLSHNREDAVGIGLKRFNRLSVKVIHR